MEDLEVIIQRMVEAGESEENIALVIENYNADKADQAEPAPEVPKEAVAEASGDSASPSAGTDSSLDSNVEVEAEKVEEPVVDTEPVDVDINEIINPELYKERTDLEAIIASRPIMSDNSKEQVRLNEINDTFDRLSKPRNSIDAVAVKKIKDLDIQQDELTEKAVKLSKNSDVGVEDILKGDGTYQDILKQKQVIKAQAQFDKTNSALKERDLLGDTFKKINANTKTAVGQVLGIPNYLNKTVFTLAASEELLQEMNKLSPEDREVAVNKMMSDINPFDVFNTGQIGAELHNEFKDKAEAINKEIAQFDTALTEDLINGDLGQFSARVLSDGIGSIPSLVQAMIPYVGIASIVAGSAAGKQEELEDEGYGLGLDTTANTIVNGAAEGLLEIFTKRLGRKLFNSFKSMDDVARKTVMKDLSDNLIKAPLYEGGSEGATSLIQNLSDMFIQGMDKEFLEVFYEVADAFFIGFGVGGGMGLTTQTVTTIKNYRNDIKIENIVKDKSNEYKSIKDVFNPDKATKVDADMASIVTMGGNIKFDKDVDKAVSSREITPEEAELYKDNYNKTHKAVSKTRGIKMTADNRVKASNLIIEKEALEQDIKNIDPVLAQPKKDRVEVINSELSSLIGVPKVADKKAGKEPTAKPEEVKPTSITAENSSNFANMTEDGEGNFVFFHRGKKGYGTVKRGTGASRVTSREEAAALGKVGGLAMYYTNKEGSEKQGSDEAQYAVKVAKDKVYDFNNDALNLIDEARELHKKEHPDKAFDRNTQVAYVAKIAGNMGFEMVVAEWAGTTRAQTTSELAPTDVRETDGAQVTKEFKGKYESNKDKGFDSVIPKTKKQALAEAYDVIHNERNKDANYDKAYSLYSDSDKYTQDEITKIVEESDLSKKSKDAYKEALAFKQGKRKSQTVDKSKATDVKSAPKGHHINVGMVEGKTNKPLTAKQIKDNLPEGVEVISEGENLVDSGSKELTLSLELSRPLTDLEMKNLLKATKQEAIPQLTDGKGSLFATSAETLKDWGGDFNPKFFSMPDGKKVSEGAKDIDADLDAFMGAPEVESAKAKEARRTKVKVLAEKAKKSLSRIAPNVSIKIYNTAAEFEAATGKKGAGLWSPSKGKGGTISINLDYATGRTVAHETVHAVLGTMIKSDKALERLTDKFLGVLAKNVDGDVKVELEEFMSRYEDAPADMSEEFTAELGGMLADNYTKLSNKAQGIVKQWLDTIAKKLGLKEFTDSEIIDLLNTIAGKTAKGEVITEADVAILSDGAVITGEIPSGIERKGKESKFIDNLELERLPTHKNVIVKKRFNLRDIAGQVASSTLSDKLVAGRLGKFVLYGGVGYPEATGLLWAASNKTSADKITNKIKKSKDGFNYLMPAIMSNVSHMSNKDMTVVAIETLREASNNGEIDLASLTASVEKAFSNKSLLKLQEGALNAIEGKANINETLDALLDYIFTPKFTFVKRRNLLQSIIGDAPSQKPRYSTVGTFTKLAGSLAEPLVKDSEIYEVNVVYRTKGTLRTVKIAKTDPRYHKSYPFAVESSEKIEVLHLVEGYNLVDIFPEFTKADGDKKSLKQELKDKLGEYTEKYIRTNHGRTHGLSSYSAPIVADKPIRKEMSQKVGIGYFKSKPAANVRSGNAEFRKAVEAKREAKRVEREANIKRLEKLQKEIEGSPAKSVEEVVQFSRDKGYEDTVIKDALLKRGFSKEQIETALATIIPTAIVKGAAKAVRDNKKSNLKSDVDAVGIEHVKSTKWYRGLTVKQKDDLNKKGISNILADKELALRKGSQPTKAGKKFRDTVKEVTGQTDTSAEVTMTKAKLLKEQIKTLVRGAKMGAKGLQDLKASFIKEISIELKSLTKSKIMTLTEARKVLAAVNQLNFKNYDKVSELVDKVIAEIENKGVRRAIKQVKTRLRKGAKSPKNPVNMRELAKEAVKVNEVYLTPAERVKYSDLLTEIQASFKLATSKTYRMANEADMFKALEVLNQKAEATRLKELATKLGLDGTGLTNSQLVELVNSVDVDEYLGTLKKEKAREARIALEKQAEYARIALNDVDGDTLTEQEKEDVRTLKEANLELLTSTDIRDLIKIVDNIVTNQTFASSGNLASKIRSYNASETATGVFNKEGTRMIDKSVITDLKSLALVFKSVFQSTRAAALFDKLSGLTKLGVAYTKHKKAMNALAKSYDELFAKLLKNHKGINKPESTMFRGLVAQLIQGTTSEDFDINKSRVEDHINKIKNGAQKQSTRLGLEVLEQQYEALKGLKSQEEVIEHAKGLKDGNWELVEFWMNHFESNKEALKYNTEVVHGKSFEEVVGNYLPIKLKADGTATEDVDNLPFFDRNGLPATNPSVTTISRTKTKKLPPNRVLDLDFDSVMFNKAAGVSIDIETSAAYKDVYNFFHSPNMAKMFGTETIGVFQKKLTEMRKVQLGIASMDVNKDETIKMVNKVERIWKTIATTIGLGSVTQYPKQYISVAFNAMAHLGSDSGLMFSAMFTDKSKIPLLDMVSVALRGETQAGTITGGTRISEAEKKATKAVVGRVVQETGLAAEKVREVLFYSLRKGDVNVAKSSWIAFYQKYLKDNNITDVDMATEHERMDEDVRQEAIAYAELKVEETQISSDESRGSEFYQSKETSRAILRGIFLPYQSFNINSKMRMLTDIRILADKKADGVDRRDAGASLLGTAAEMITFQTMKYYVLAQVVGLGKAALEYMFGLDSPDEDDKKKEEFRFKQWYSALAKDLNPLAIGSFAEDMVIETLNLMQYFADAKDDEAYVDYIKRQRDNGGMMFYRYKDKHERGKGFGASLLGGGGLYSIPYSQFSETLDAYELMMHSTNRDDWGNLYEYKFSDNQKLMLKFAFAAEFISMFGLGEADSRRLLRKMRRDATKKGVTKKKKIN